MSLRFGRFWLPTLTAGLFLFASWSTSLAAHGQAIEGTVVFADGGAPLFNFLVEVYEDQGSVAVLVGSDRTDASGDYLVTSLPTGNLFVVAVAETSAAVSELYDDISCPSGSCPILTGTPVPVAAATTTSGIDFGLDRPGKISGVITDAVTTSPIGPGLEVRAVHPTTGATLDSTTTNASGEFVLDYPENQDSLVWSGGMGYAGEFYDDIPCEFDTDWTCDLGTATVVPFVLNQTAANTNLALDEFGGISGQITKAVGGSGFASAEVRIYDDTGAFVESTTADGSGNYSFSQLAPGDYYVLSRFINYLQELYDGVFCHGDQFVQLVCDLGGATTVTASLNTVAMNIDIALDRAGSIQGDVSLPDGASGAVNSRSMRLYTETGEEYASKSLGFQGDYSFTNVIPGTYFLATYAAEWLNEVWDDVPCGAGRPLSCDPTTATPIVIAVGEQRMGVDFVVFPDETGFGGRVRIAGPATPVGGVQVDLWDDSGTMLTSVVSSPDGSYFFELVPGTYFVSTTVPQGFIDQIFSGIACPAGPASEGGCDPTTGTPITILSGDDPLLGADFNLEQTGTIFTDGFESGSTSAWTLSVPGP